MNLEELERCWLTGNIREIVTLYKPDLEAKNTDGYTPLQMIMNTNSCLALRCKPLFLINLGYRADSLDKNGNSLLHLYAKTNKSEYIPYIEKLKNE